MKDNNSNSPGCAEVDLNVIKIPTDFAIILKQLTRKKHLLAQGDIIQLGHHAQINVKQIQIEASSCLMNQSTM